MRGLRCDRISDTLRRRRVDLVCAVLVGSALPPRIELASCVIGAWSMWIVVRAGGGRAGGMAGARLPPGRGAGRGRAGMPVAVSCRVARARDVRCDSCPQRLSANIYTAGVRSVRPLDLQRPRYK